MMSLKFIVTNLLKGGATSLDSEIKSKVKKEIHLKPVLEVLRK